MFERGKRGIGAINDSLTVRHIATALEQVDKAMTTAHIEQRLQNPAPIQGQGSAVNPASGNVVSQLGSPHKKTS